MAGKRNAKKSKPKKPKGASRPKGVVEAIYAWSEQHGYWKTLVAAIAMIFAYCFAGSIAKHLFP